MSKIDMTTLNRIAKTTTGLLKKKAPAILTGVGIAGFISAGIMGIKVTPLALELIDERKEELEVEELTPVETIKTTWTCYAPVAGLALVSAACVVGGSTISAKRSAALATAYALSEGTLKEYKDKVVETIGEKKEKEVRDAIAKDRIEKNPVVSDKVFNTGKGNTLCYDGFSGVGGYFRSDIEVIRKAVNEVNRRLLLDNYISLNDFYEEIGLEPTKLGYTLGWNIEQSLIEVDFSSQLTPDKEPCLVIDFKNPPVYDYDRFI